MVDSIAKKMKLTSMFAEHTGQRNFRAYTSRMEDLAQDKKLIGHYDHVIARAVAPITSLINWTKPLIKKNGTYVLLKGGDLTEEKREALQSFPNLVIEEINIQWTGIDWFAQEEKKILVCTFS